MKPTHTQLARYWRLQALAHRANAMAHAANPFITTEMARAIGHHLLDVATLYDREAEIEEDLAARERAPRVVHVGGATP